MPTFIGHLALITVALFTSAASYINFAEQPARLSLDDRSLLAEWKPAYKRGYSMQAPLAIVGFVFGAISWWSTSRLAFIAGAVLMLAQGIIPALFWSSGINFKPSGQN